ncbi:uncharacterized protein LOC143768230 [Ranitomeya variabilis]|uniref:uncharacterized protein LOC143768230 n=1 Tax=Ranitomeya variabilis TaxID=490064 RepID=UPI0040564723
MDMDRDKMAERILHLTLEILFRLTGEDYTVVKKTSSERCQDPVSEGRGRPLSPITGPQPHPLIHENINDQKILELTYKMIELLTGEVPIRCQDVAVYFSMEEWEYLEGHKDLYKDIMMEVPQPLKSPDLSSRRTTPERCPHPLLPQDCKQEDPNVPQDHQCEDLTRIHTTETYVRGDEWCKEEIPTYDYPVGFLFLSEIPGFLQMEVVGAPADYLSLCTRLCGPLDDSRGCGISSSGGGATACSLPPRLFTIRQVPDNKARPMEEACVWGRSSSYQRWSAVLEGGGGCVVRAKKTNKSKYKECALCMQPLPDTYLKRLCQSCIDQTLQDEAAVTTTNIRAIIRQEIQSLGSKSLKKHGSKRLSPVSSSESEEGLI